MVATDDIYRLQVLANVVTEIATKIASDVALEVMTEAARGCLTNVTKQRQTENGYLICNF